MKRTIQRTCRWLSIDLCKKGGALLPLRPKDHVADCRPASAALQGSAQREHHESQEEMSWLSSLD